MLHLNDQKSTSYLYNTQACVYLSFRYKDIIHINKLIKKITAGSFYDKIKKYTLHLRKAGPSNYKFNN